MGETEFFKGGDNLHLSGKGTLDLPAFGPVTLVAPGDNVLMAPACGTVCPMQDRARDLVVVWVKGGVERVVRSDRHRERISTSN